MRSVNLGAITSMSLWYRTQWLHSHLCRTKSSRETEQGLRKFVEPTARSKVIYADNLLEFGKACEDLPWNHCTPTPHRSETNGITERAVRRVKEPPRYFCNPVWMKNCGFIPCIVTAICEMFKNSYRTGKHPTSGALENHLVDQQFLLDR